MCQNTGNETEGNNGEDNSSLIQLYNNTSGYANYVSGEMYKLATIYTALILAMITVSVAISTFITSQERILLIIFPSIGIILCIFGILTLKHQSEIYYKTLYSLSNLRREFSPIFYNIFRNYNVQFRNSIPISLSKAFEEIGIYHIDFDKYNNVCTYLKDNVIRFRKYSIRTTLYILYFIFIIINILIILIFIFIKNNGV